MAGETEAASEEITVNEMRVRVQVGGSRHYVVAVVAGHSEQWMVDHAVIEVGNGDVVGFLNSADAEHFIAQSRARDLGRWNSAEELRRAWEAAQHHPDAESDPTPETSETHHQQRRKGGRQKA